MKSLEPKLVTSAMCVLPGKMTAIYSTMFQFYVTKSVHFQPVCILQKECILPSNRSSTLKGSFLIIMKKKLACQKQQLQLCVFLDVLDCFIVPGMYSDYT